MIIRWSIGGRQEAVLVERRGRLRLRTERDIDIDHDLASLLRADVLSIVLASSGEHDLLSRHGVSEQRP